LRGYQRRLLIRLQLLVLAMDISSDSKLIISRSAANFADTLDRDPGRIGSGVDGADADADAEAYEISAVAKQSVETLMAGEKITDTIEMADADRALTRDYEDSRARTTDELKEALMSPTRNPTLIAMGNLSPEDYVRGVVEKVPPGAGGGCFVGVAVQAGHLASGISKHVGCNNTYSLSAELNRTNGSTGNKHRTRLASTLLPPTHTSPSDRFQPYHAQEHARDSFTPAHRLEKTKVGLQHGGSQVYQATACRQRDGEHARG
jgi:hypothetical protein